MKSILKIYNNSVLPTFLYGSENWTLTALQRRRIEAAEMKSLRPLAGYTLYGHKTNDYTCRELRITGILDKIGECRRNWLSHLQRKRTCLDDPEVSYRQLYRARDWVSILRTPYPTQNLQRNVVIEYKFYNLLFLQLWKISYSVGTACEQDQSWSLLLYEEISSLRWELYKGYK